MSVEAMNSVVTRPLDPPSLGGNWWLSLERELATFTLAEMSNASPQIITEGQVGTSKSTPFGEKTGFQNVD